MINFNRPHFANNIKSFWDRWHISLTTWFRDYIYIPLGGNRKGFYRQLLNVAIIFIISGIWHGANNTFIVWGFLHALYTIIYMLFNNRFKNFAFRDSRIWNIFSYSVTNILVVFAYIFFRAENISQSQQIISNIVQRVQPSMFKIVLLDAEQMGGFGIVSILISVVAILYMIIVEKLYKPKLLELNQQPIKDIFFFTITTIFVIIAGVFVKESFIYFQF